MEVKQEHIDAMKDKKRNHSACDEMLSNTDFGKKGKKEKIEYLLKIDESLAQDKLTTMKIPELIDLHENIIITKYPDFYKQIFPKSKKRKPQDPSAEGEEEGYAEGEEEGYAEQEERQIEAFLKPNYKVIQSGTAYAEFEEKDPEASDETYVISTIWDLVSFISAEAGLRTERAITKELQMLRKEFFLNSQYCPESWEVSVNNCVKLIMGNLKGATKLSGAGPSGSASAAAVTAGNHDALKQINEMLIKTNADLREDIQRARNDLERKESELAKVKDKYKKLKSSKEGPTKASQLTDVKNEPVTVTKGNTTATSSKT